MSPMLVSNNKSPPMKFKCGHNGCNHISHSKASSYAHNRKHAPEIDCYCGCHRKFKRQDQHAEHLGSVFKIKTHQCPYCKQPLLKSRIQRHVREQNCPVYIKNPRKFADTPKKAILLKKQAEVFNIVKAKIKEKSM